jgi:phosphate transport system permease protein
MTTASISTTLDFSRTSARGLRRRMQSGLMFTVCVGFTAFILLILTLVVGYLVSIGLRSMNWAMFTQNPIPPGMKGYPGGMAHAIVGTAILVGLSSLVGLPVGLLTGIFLAEYDARSRLATPVRFIADVLAGVPSIVVGILGYELLVVPLGHYNGWAGSLALAFIMIPIVARTTEEMLRLIPDSYREAAMALGATKSRTIMGIVIPAATGSVVTGVMLAVARVAGETAPLLFTALGSRFFTVNPNEPFPSLTVQIFNYATGPYPAQKSEAWAAILLLIFLIFLLNLGVRYFTRQRK